MAENRRFKGKTKSYARVDSRTGRIVKWVKIKDSMRADRAVQSRKRKTRRHGHQGD